MFLIKTHNFLLKTIKIKNSQKLELFALFKCYLFQYIRQSFYKIKQFLI
jgi:hypothetical protein